MMAAVPCDDSLLCCSTGSGEHSIRQVFRQDHLVVFWYKERYEEENCRKDIRLAGMQRPDPYLSGEVHEKD
jgi:hypothetical protein